MTYNNSTQARHKGSLHLEQDTPHDSHNSKLQLTQSIAGTNDGF